LQTALFKAAIGLESRKRTQRAGSIGSSPICPELPEKLEFLPVAIGRKTSIFHSGASCSGFNPAFVCIVFIQDE